MADKHVTEQLLQHDCCTQSRTSELSRQHLSCSSAWWREGSLLLLPPDLASFTLFSSPELPVSVSCAEWCKEPRAPRFVRVRVWPGAGRGRGCGGPTPRCISTYLLRKFSLRWHENSFASSVPFITPPTQCFLFRNGNIIVIAISEISLPKSGSAEEYLSVRRGKGSLRVISGVGNLFTWVWEKSRG